ncbi:unnamed protein product [Parascedosporium putredinis]|uniref:Uncharacterized protein n=1 Tax=Parascedosporium putredinis TaxID=1442378 RepID=A0A9P1M9B7_9PEZI|nr:unnamed protein product [Parascedosporium putredinis]CAI7995383.1 unnamed protein product [Parascedosporium putredinis]
MDRIGLIPFVLDGEIKLELWLVCTSLRCFPPRAPHSARGADSLAVPKQRVVSVGVGANGDSKPVAQFRTASGSVRDMIARFERNASPIAPPDTGLAGAGNKLLGRVKAWDPVSEKKEHEIATSKTASISQEQEEVLSEAPEEEIDEEDLEVQSEEEPENQTEEELETQPAVAKVESPTLESLAEPVAARLSGQDQHLDQPESDKPRETEEQRSDLSEAEEKAEGGVKVTDDNIITEKQTAEDEANITDEKSTEDDGDDTTDLKGAPDEVVDVESPIEGASATPDEPVKDEYEEDQATTPAKRDPASVETF